MRLDKPVYADNDCLGPLVLVCACGGGVGGGSLLSYRAQWPLVVVYDGVLVGGLAASCGAVECVCLV